MSNKNDFWTEDRAIWRTRLPINREVLKLLEDDAKATKRTVPAMAAYIIEQFYRGGERNGVTNERQTER